jgi:hypothetical protein
VSICDGFALGGDYGCKRRQRGFSDGYEAAEEAAEAILAATKVADAKLTATKTAEGR